MKEAILKKSWVVEGFNTFGKYCLSALQGVALMTGGIGGLLIVGILLLVMAFPVFLFVSVLLKIIG